MKRRRVLWPLVSALVIVTQLCQPLGLVPAAAGQPLQGLSLPRPAAPSQVQPTVANQTLPGPAGVTAPETVPSGPALISNPCGATPPTSNVAYGNNNLGQSYFDIGNTDDHPGRHFAGPVNLVNGNLFLTTGDTFFAGLGLSVEFARSYNSQDITTTVPFSVPLGLGWTDSYNSAVVAGIGVTPISGTVVVIRGGDGTLYPYTFNGLFWLPPAGYCRFLQHPSAGSPFFLSYKNGLTEVYTPNGQLQSTHDRNNNQLTFGYDGFGRLTSVTDTSGLHSLTLAYNVSNTLQSIADPLGRMTTYQYDGTGRLSQVNYPEGSHATYTYDGSGRLVGYDDPRQPPGTTQATITYTGNQATHVQYPNFPADSFFDVFFSAGSTDWTDSVGNQQRIVYDSFNNVTQDLTRVGGVFQGDTWTYSVPANLRPTLKQDANGGQTQYAYDPSGNLTLVVDPTGATTRFLYDLNHNNVISTTNPLGNTTLYTYDSNGNLNHEIDPSSPLPHELTYTLSLNGGNLLETQDSAGRTTGYGYDQFGNLVVVTDTLGNHITHSYDAAGRVTQTIDPSGQPTLYQYDAGDRLVTLTDPLSGTLHYSYDAHSNLTHIVEPEGDVISQTYDNLDRQLQVTDSMTNSTQYRYDTAGRLVLRTDATGQTTTFGYDGASRLITRTYSGGRQDLFTYDAGGRLTGMTNGTISTTMAYDPASRPITISLTALGVFTGTRAIYSYDLMGNRVKDLLQASSGPQWQTLYQYDALGRLVKTTDNANRQWVTTYDAAGCRATRTLPDGSHEAYTYDPDCQLTQLRHFTAGNALIRSFGYTYR